MTPEVTVIYVYYLISVYLLQVSGSRSLVMQRLKTKTESENGEIAQISGCTTNLK